MKTVKIYTILVSLLLTILIGQKSAFAMVETQSSESQGVAEEQASEHTNENYEKKVAEFYQAHANFIVVSDLKNQNGIDRRLLPNDIAMLVTSNTKVIAYKETRLAGSSQTLGIDESCQNGENIGQLGIGCASASGTRDLTVSTVYGGVTQYSRVLAIWYYGYSGCQRLCGGWEFEQQWSKWDRSSSAWTIGSNSAKMRTHTTSAENFCTEGNVSLDKSSNWFTPTWSGNSTNWWSISGFADIAYVPFPTAVSYTQADIYQSGVLKHNDAQTQQIFRNTGTS